MRALFLHRSVALDVVKDMTKQRFRAYVQQAQKERDRRSAAQVLKKLVQVSPDKRVLLLVCIWRGGVGLGECVLGDGVLKKPVQV
jgi:hypothetical protein